MRVARRAAASAYKAATLRRARYPVPPSAGRLPRFATRFAVRLRISRARSVVCSRRRVRTPAALPVLAIVAGTALGLAAGLPPAFVAAASIVLAWAAALVCYLAGSPRFFVVFVSLSFAVSGGVVGAAADRRALQPSLIRECPPGARSGPLGIEGRLRADAAPTIGGTSLDLEVLALDAGPQRKTTAGGVRLSVSGDLARARVGEWRAGRTIGLSAQLREAGLFRDPGVADARLALARRGTCLVGSVKSAALVETRSPGSWADEAAAEARQRTRAVVARYVGRWSRRSAAIVVAILIGDRAGLDEEVERRLQEAGTYHVIAISGGNIAILAALTVWLLRLLRVGHRPAAILGILVLTGYAFTVGGGASVVRATLMAVIFLAARLADHQGSALNALAVAGAIVFAAVPLSIFDVGCALTFGATLGILIGASRVMRAFPARWYLRWPLALLAASACAELALFPVSARAFFRVTFAGLILNFAAIPLMSVVQVAGMLVLPLAAVHASAASAAGWVAHVAAEGLIRTASLVEWAPWLSYRLPPPHAAWLVVYYAGWCAWLALAQPSGGGLARLRRWARRVAVALVTGSGVWILVEPVTLLVPGVKGALRVAVLDVGHADAVLVQLPDRRNLLVDAGGSLTGSSFDIGGRIVAPALWALRVRRLDVLVLSHGDPDHIGGAASIIRDFRPREVWEGVPVPPSERLQALRRDAEAAGARWRTCLAGEHGTFGAVRWHVWHPPPPDWERQRVRNDDSVVLELRYGDVSILLPGDIGRPVEQGLLQVIPPAPLRVLKVPHHGSVSSSTDEFVTALRPRVAVLSAGAITKVSDVVLARYREVGATLFRTDQDGATIVTTDGRTLTVRTFTGRTEVFKTDSTTKDTKDTKEDPRGE